MNQGLLESESKSTGRRFLTVRADGGYPFPHVVRNQPLKSYKFATLSDTLCTFPNPFSDGSEYIYAHNTHNFTDPFEDIVCYVKSGGSSVDLWRLSRSDFSNDLDTLYPGWDTSGNMRPTSLVYTKIDNDVYVSIVLSSNSSDDQNIFVIVNYSSGVIEAFLPMTNPGGGADCAVLMPEDGESVRYIDHSRHAGMHRIEYIVNIRTRVVNSATDITPYTKLNVSGPAETRLAFPLIKLDTGFYTTFNSGSVNHVQLIHAYDNVNGVFKDISFRYSLIPGNMLMSAPEMNIGNARFQHLSDDVICVSFSMEYTSNEPLEGTYYKLFFNREDLLEHYKQIELHETGYNMITS